MDPGNKRNRGFYIDRPTRYPLEVTFAVRTFGNPIPYDLKSKNVSLTGFLMGSYFEVPFRVSTILEIKIDPLVKDLPKSLECVGKVVRMADQVESKSDNKIVCLFGVKIIEIPRDSYLIWEDFINNLSPNGGF